MSNRFDSLDNHYKIIDIFDKISKVLYWAIVALSITILYVKDIRVNNFFSVLFIILTFSFSITNNILKIYLIPRIENKRRVHLISNSLGICLDHERTNGYYNNNIGPSILRLGANVFENSLFAKTVVSKMLFKERIKIAIYTIIFIASMLFKDFDLSVISIIAQTLFSGEIICKWLYMEYLRYENERIFEDMNRIFLSYVDTKKDEFQAQIIDSFVRYEAVKAYCGIKQSSKIFFEVNSITSEKWEEIKKSLKIDEYVNV